MILTVVTMQLLCVVERLRPVLHRKGLDRCAKAFLFFVTILGLVMRNALGTDYGAIIAHTHHISKIAPPP